MLNTSPATRLVAGAGAALVLVGCAGGDAAPPDSATSSMPVTASAPPPTTEAASTSEPPPTLSAAEQDRADVETTVVAYAEALSEVLQGADAEELYPWSRDVAREQWVTQTLAYREQGLVLEGDVPVDVLEVEVDGDQADVVACLDYSDTAVTDAEGQDITPDRETGDLILNDYVLERYEDGEHGWIVVDDTSRSEPCDA